MKRKILTLYIFIFSLISISTMGVEPVEMPDSFSIEKPKKEIKLYPNPAKTFVKISFQENYTEEFKIRVFDLLGKEYIVNVEKEADKLVYIALNNFKSGFYFVEVIFPNKHRLVKKFMVKDQ